MPRALRLAVHAVAIALSAVIGWAAFGDLVTAPPRPAMPADGQAGERFGLTAEKRRELFDFMTQNLSHMRRSARSTFPEHAWSQQDHLAQLLWNRAKVAEREFDVHRSIVHAVLEEGIREGWPAKSGGKPLDRSIVPLELRK